MLVAITDDLVRDLLPGLASITGMQGAVDESREKNEGADKITK
jgi:hypothetical protein